MNFRLLIPISFLLLLFSSCNKDKEKETGPVTTGFDKQAMLVNMADHVILPAYQAYWNSVDSLRKAWTVFKNQSDIGNLQLLRSRFHEAYTLYQSCDLFEFGPAESLLFRANNNVFPADTIQILNNISSGTYNLQTLANLDAKGWPALDYLFYHPGYTDQELVGYFTNSPSAVKYAEDLIQELFIHSQTIVSGWVNTYREIFVNSLGTDVGSSIGYVINQLNFQLDYLKNAKLGIPLGKKSLGVIQPRQCEAYYSGYSLVYCKATLEAIEAIYLGQSQSGENGKGLDDYLDHLKVQYNGTTLNSAIITQFQKAREKLGGMQGPISLDVQQNFNQTDQAYAALVKLLVLLKTDMPSSLGVVITYQDGDGD